MIHVHCILQGLLTGCGHGQALGASLQRVQLTGNDPSDRAPGAGEEEDVDAYECNGRALSWEIGGACDCAGDGYDVWETVSRHLTERWKIGSYIDRRTCRWLRGGGGCDDRASQPCTDLGR
jgi:hypothetical protein